MKITLDSGTVLVPTTSQKNEIMKILLGEKEKPVKENKPRKHRAILGRKSWTQEEDAVLKTYPRLIKSDVESLSRQFVRTGNAIHQRHSKLVTNHHDSFEPKNFPLG